MKKLFRIFFVPKFFRLKSEKTIKEKIIGEWQLKTVSSEELTEKEKSTVINFKEDGNAINSRREKDVKKWEVKSKDDKEYLILGDEEFEIKSINDKKLIILQKDNEITFTRK